MKRVIRSSIDGITYDQVRESIAQSIEVCARKFIKDFDTSFSINISNDSIKLYYSEGRVPQSLVFECIATDKVLSSYFYIEDIEKSVLREFRKWIVNHSTSNKKFRTTWKILYSGMFGITYQGTYAQARNNGVISLVRANEDLVNPYDRARADSIRNLVTIKLNNPETVLEVEENPNYKEQLKSFEPEQPSLF